MNLEEKRKRLKSLLEENIRAGNVGTAIAITGSWGIGKTFFWNSFRDEVNFKKKYVYVSLFGLESLSDLKTHIYSNIENNHSALEIPRWIRGLPSILKDTRVSQFGVSASAKVFDSLMFNQVKDAIICFDDFERMSKKLDIKDVMGLANYLKLEKNCQIILILDEDKAEGDNKKKYAEYKEKLIDETIIINSVEPLIRANAQDMDAPLVELMVEFAEELEIHNFRFFQKVIRLYREFREQLPDEVAESTKEIILIRVLQGYLITDFSQLEYGWDDSTYFVEQKRAEWNERKKQTYESLQKISNLFIHSDNWLIEFKKWFDQVGELDFSLLNKLANSTLISEQNNKIKNDFHKCCEDFWGLQVNQKFPEIFYERTRRVVGLENLSNLSFALQVLELFEKDVTVLEQEIIDWLKVKIEKDTFTFRSHDSFGEVRPIFKNFIATYKADKEKLPNLIDAIFNIYVRQAWSNKDELSVQHASKEDWEKILFEEISLDSRFNSISSSYIVKKVLEREKDSELGQQIRNVITEIYNEKAKEDEFYKNYMSFLISRLDN